MIERGFRPLVLERGKAVEDRKKDLNGLYKTGMVDEDSNFGFGEGGAGTFSDGKLYTRSKKRGDVRRAMEIFVYHGANPAILVEAHPHVGTDKLPGVIVNIRKTIQKQGGEIRFGCRVSDLIIRENSIQGVIAGGQEIASRHVILATGHSARDIYRMLQRRGVRMEPKDFAVGLRLEHSQQEIDRIQYHTPEGRGKWLPAAEYNFVTNIDGRGVYSFCMCPGGYVVNASSEPEILAVNGMSYQARDSRNANSALIVSVTPEDFPGKDALAGVVFQSDIEKGIFSCYEVKSCKEDVYSGNGLNFVGEKNYIVTTMQCYKDIQEDLRNGRLHNHIKNCNPESSPYFGIIVPVPEYVDAMSEFENPSQFDRSCSWKMHTILPCHSSGRKRPTTELLFCMLRAGR